MAPIERLQEAERQMLELLESADLPEPDEIEYEEECVRLLWHDKKLAIIIDMD